MQRRQQATLRDALIYLTESGPGAIHAFTALENAQMNCRAMILRGGASPDYQNSMGVFQEECQVEISSSPTVNKHVSSSMLYENPCM